MKRLCVSNVKQRLNKWAFIANFIVIGCLVYACSACLQTTVDYQGRKVFNPDYLFYLESGWRDDWQRPDEVMKALEISKTDVIADIGAGGGYFTERFSKYLGPSGRVYATDIQDVMIEKLRERVKNQGLDNVEVVRGGLDEPKLSASCCDLVFFSSVYKEIEGRIGYMKKVRKILKPGGRVAIIEYRPNAAAIGPPKEMRLSPEKVIKELAAAGFTLVRRHNFLPREYFLIFVPESYD